MQTPGEPLNLSFLLTFVVSSYDLFLMDILARFVVFAEGEIRARW